MIDGIGEYGSFAPPGWSAPPLDEEIEHTRALLGDPQVWCLVAECGGEIVGQITVMPAARAALPVDEPGLGHYRNLFVRSDFWGTSLARTLDAEAVAAARERGFTQLRLFVAAGQQRARRFYEREGWAAATGEFHDPVPNLVMVEYRRVL
jgi:GNAT superfamily N-acetyltransferase